jgi:hypothetical protein
MPRVALLALVAVLAACGGASRPQLDHASAAQLIALAHRIGHEGACAQARDVPRLQTRAVELVNAHRVPAALQEPLMSGVSALQAPLCLPPAQVSQTTGTTTPAPPAPPARAPKGHGHVHERHPPRHHHEHGHGHGEGD